MSNNIKPLSFTVQSLLIILFAFTLLLSFDGGLNLHIGMQTYYLAGSSFVEGKNPYEITLNMGYPQFKYSPLFAFIMSGHLQEKNQLGILLIWLIVGMAAFSFGLSRWCDFTRKAPLYIAFAFHAAILDLVISMEAYQINALITGLILLGLSEYRDGRYFSSGAILMLATNFKVFPIIFLLALASRFRPMYWYGALSAGIVAFILPVLAVGWSHNINMHFAWFALVVGDITGTGMLDIISAFQRLGLDNLGQLVRSLVFITSVSLFFSYFCFVKCPDWRPWMTFGFASLLLLSPRTEIFTYVLLAPSYILMCYWCAESEQPIIRSYGGLVFTLTALLIACCRFKLSSVYLSSNPHEIIRPIGAMVYWILAVIILARELLNSGNRLRGVHYIT